MTSPPPDSPAEATAQPEPTPLGSVTNQPIASNRTWRILAWLSPVLALALTSYVMWGAKWPVFPFDEITLLQLSRFLGGQEVPDAIRGAGYYPAWAVLTTPVWWFTSDPSVGYQATLWIGLLVSMGTIVPLAAIVRRFTGGLAPAVVIASWIMMLPARAIQADFSLSERLVIFALALSVLAAFRIAEKPTLLRHALFVMALGLLFFSHVRTSVVLVAAAVWLMMRMPRHFRVSAVALVLLVVTYLGVDRLAKALIAALLGPGFARGDKLLQRISDSSWDLFLRTAIGQSWYQSVASFGLVAFGLLVLVLVVWQELRRVDFGAMTFILGATVVTVFISLAQWSNDYLLFIEPWVRLDGWIYGRYIDPIATVLIGIGLVVLLRGLSGPLIGIGVLMNLAVAAMAIGYLTREVPTWGYVTPAHIPGVLPWEKLLPTQAWPRDIGIFPTLTNENRIWIIAPLCVLVVLLLTIALRRKPAIAMAVLLPVAIVATVLADQRSDSFSEIETSWVGIRDRLQSVTKLEPQTSIGFVRGCETRGTMDAPAENYSGYAVAPAPMRFIEDTDPKVGELEVLIACDRWRTGEALGARRVEGDSIFASQVWVMPGPLQDRLAAEGRLLPAFDPKVPPPPGDA